MARILLTTFGSLGDLFPYLALGRELHQRNHIVTVATSAAHGPHVQAAGLRFHTVRPDVDFGNRDLLAYVMDARHGSERVVRYVASQVRDSYQDTLDAARNADAIVSHPVTFGSVLVAQQLKLPWISTVLAPLSLISSYDPPVSPQSPWLHRLRVMGPGVMGCIWRLARRYTRPWVQPVLDLRRELGLPSGGHPLFDGSHSPRLVLALFSRYLAAPQPDWPRSTIVTGFPFYDNGELSAELLTYLSDGPAPVVFTLGSSAVAAAGDFYVESLAAVRRLGCRAIFLTGSHPQGLPDRLPANVLSVDYAPHGPLFARAAAIVHQGGIGTTAQAMRSGHSELFMPFGHDQFDNAERVRRLGVAEVLYRSQYRARRVAGVLGSLLGERRYGQSAVELGEKVRSENGAVTAADAIERSLG